jgi:homoserine O-acetyltransferase
MAVAMAAAVSPRSLRFERNHPMNSRSKRLAIAAAMLLAGFAYVVQADDASKEIAVARALEPSEGDFAIRHFRFQSGQTLESLRIHYATLGKPHRDAAGHVDNAVLVLHGTGGSGDQFLTPVFAGELFGPGQPLDVSRYYIVLPDSIGHGHSSKPSDGLRAKFPDYGYTDMVAAQYALVTQKLGIDHLRLVMGTSMGCMHSFMWGEFHAGFVDALMPLACLPVEIAGRNRMWRKMLIDAIREDPAWDGGNYTHEPEQGLRTAVDMLLIAGSAPQQLQRQYPTGRSVDDFLAQRVPKTAAHLDANDLMYQVAASRDYDPMPHLADIKVPVMWVNSADDFINPPYLGIAEHAVKNMPRGHFELIPAGDHTYGHGTHTHAAVWKPYLMQLLRESSP